MSPRRLLIRESPLRPARFKYREPLALARLLSVLPYLEFHARPASFRATAYLDICGSSTDRGLGVTITTAPEFAFLRFDGLS